MAATVDSRHQHVHHHDWLQEERRENTRMIAKAAQLKNTKRKYLCANSERMEGTVRSFRVLSLSLFIVPCFLLSLRELTLMHDERLRRCRHGLRGEAVLVPQ